MSQPTAHVLPDPRRAGRAMGAMFFSVFGGAWLCVAGSPQARRRSRIFNIVNVAQWIVIVVVGNVLANLGLAQWVIPAAIFVIGAHFLPLARLFSNPPHYVTGAGLMLLAAGYPLATSTGAGNPVGCLGAGLILWLSAAWALSPARAAVE